MSRNRVLGWMTLASVAAIFDIYFKYIAITRLPETGRVSIPFDLILHKNLGIAFNIPIPLPIVVTFSLLVLISLFAYFKAWWPSHPEKVVAGFVLFVGTLGNMLDRLVNGFTTDYMLLFGRSVFNISDILIVTGIILLIRYTKTEG